MKTRPHTESGGSALDCDDAPDIHKSVMGATSAGCFFSSKIRQRLSAIESDWIRSTALPSGNLASNTPLPRSIRDKLFAAENLAMSHLDHIEFLQCQWEDTTGIPSNLFGLRHVVSLQRLSKPGHLTLYRSIRFPTPKRIADCLGHEGMCLDNFEQERLGLLYTDSQYVGTRQRILSEEEFQFLPQERVVSGLPAFIYANDALQIHSAFRRSDNEIVLLAVCYIPKTLLIDGVLALSGNPPYALNFDDSSDDFPIDVFVDDHNDRCMPDLASFRSVGIELYETYIHGFPKQLEQLATLGISTSFFLVPIQKLVDPINRWHNEMGRIPQSLRTPELNGIFGNWSPFFRRPTRYLPTSVAEARGQTRS